MDFDARPSPARVTAAAAAKLPRWALAILLAAYIVPGLFGRDPWADDATGFGLMWTMAHGHAADWWLPNVAGAALPEEGPLPFWLGAAAIAAFGGLLGDPLASRLAAVLWFGLATASIWYATYRLARRTEAQPIAFVFGGEAKAVDYGRMLADIAVLLFLGTIGIVPRLHETVAESAALALVCALLYGLALALEQPRRGAALAGLAIGALGLSRGLAPALAAAIAALYVLLRFAPAARRLVAAVALIAAALGLFVVWPIGAYVAEPDAAPAYLSAWLQWNTRGIGLIGLTDAVWLVRNFPWYTWPLWPLAAWTLYAWRHGLDRPHIVVAAAPAAALLILFAASEPIDEPALMLIVPPLVLLAAFGAATLRRAAENLMDWFALVVFSFFLFVVWAYYVAAMTGVPPKMAASVARLAPGFAVPFTPLACATAVAVTAAWFALVVWRIRSRPPMLWRGPALAAGGLVALWLVLIALFLPSINYVRSYVTLAHELRVRIDETVGPGACVQAHHVQLTQRAVLAYEGLRFGADQTAAACPLALHFDSPRTRLDDDPPVGTWRLVWEGRRRARPEEVWRLWQRRGG
jgi:4-amino-4-deoxy-L-arabinose transferase-like glycosyltransferase